MSNLLLALFTLVIQLTVVIAIWEYVKVSYVKISLVSLVTITALVTILIIKLM